jgi:hypothetical protein
MKPGLSIPVGQTIDRSAITSTIRRPVINCTVSHQWEPMSATAFSAVHEAQGYETRPVDTEDFGSVLLRFDDGSKGTPEKP